MKNTLKLLAAVAVGIFIGLLLSLIKCKGGNVTPTTEHYRDSIEYRDRIVPVPQPYPEYVTVTKIDRVPYRVEIKVPGKDSIIIRWDTAEFKVDTSLMAKKYVATDSTKDYVITQRATVDGMLYDWGYDIKLFKDSTVTTQPVVKYKKRNFTIGAAVANNLYWKPTVGYKGVVVEPVFQGKEFQHIYLGYQIRF